MNKMRRLPGPADCRLSEGDQTPEALYELFRDWQRTQTQSSTTALQGPRLQMDVWFCRAQEPMEVGYSHLTLLSSNRHRPDRTATAAPHAFGVDETLHTRWQHNVALSGSIILHYVATYHCTGWQN